MRRAIACLFLAGCGRLAFDAATNDATDAQAADAEDAAVNVPKLIEVGPTSFATTSTTFVDVPNATITVPASPGQKWLLLVSGLLASDQNLYNAPEVQYLVDGVVHGIGGTENVTLGRSGPWQHFDSFVGAGVPKTITFQLRDTLGGTTQLADLHAVAVPVPDAADLLFEGSDGPTLVTSTTPTTAASLTLSPASVGEYLIFLVANTTEAPGSADLDSQWLDPAGAPWSAGFKNPRGAWQSYMLIRRATLGPGPATLVFQASTGTTAQVAYVRVAALRIDAFVGRFAYGNNPAYLANATATPMTTVALTPPLDAASSYVLVGTTHVDDDCGNAVLAERDLQFSVDGVSRYHGVHAAGNCAYETTYGYVDAQAQPPASFGATFSSANGQNLEHRETTLVVLGIP
jgi:hypothetical protein